MRSFAAAKAAFSPSDLDLQPIRLGFRPAAAIAWWSQQSGDGVEAGNRGGMGFWTTDECASVAWASDDGAKSIRTAHVADRAALLGVDGAEGGVAMRADVAFESEGVTVRWTRRPSEHWLVHVLAFGGASLTDPRVGWLPAPPAVGARDFGQTAIRSDLVLLVPAPAPLAGDGAPAGLAIGMSAMSDAGQAAAAYACARGAPPGAVTAFQRRGAAPAALEEHHGVRRFCYLGLAGLRARIGTDASPRRPGARRTRVGFRPEALLLFSWGLARSRKPKKIGRFCLGGASADASGCICWDDRNVEAPETSTHVASSLEHVLVVTDTQTGDIHAEAALTSVDETGFTLDWTRSDGHARQFAYVALGAPRAAAPGSRARTLVSRIARAAGRF